MDISISISEEDIKKLIIADVKAKIPGINVSGVNFVSGRGSNAGLRAEIESDFGKAAIQASSVVREDTPEPTVVESAPESEDTPVVPDEVLEELSDEADASDTEEEEAVTEETPKARKLFGNKKD